MTSPIPDPPGENTSTVESVLTAPNLRRAGSSIRWKMIGSLVERLTSILALSVLARLLDKSDFGLVHLAIAALSLLGMLRDVGVPQAIIQRRDASSTFIETCFWVRMAVGVGLYAAIVVLAWPIGRFFDEPSLVPILFVMGTTYFLDALPTVQESVLIRDLKIREATIARIVSMVLGLSAAIALAFLGYGPWALVANGVVATVAAAVVLFPLCSWRPAGRFHLGDFRHLVGFGGHLTGTQLLAWFTENFSITLLGKAYTGTSDVGVFRQAYVIGKWPDSLIGSVLGGGLVVSLFARVQHDAQRMQAALRQTTSLLYLVGLPLASAIIIFAHDIIMVVYGPRWVEVVPLCRVIAVGGTFLMMRLTLRHWLVAAGHSQVLFRNQAVIAVAAVILTVSGLALGGIMGVTIGTTLACVFEAVLLWYSCQELTAVRPIDWWRHSWRSFAVSFIVGVAMYIFSRWAIHWESPTGHTIIGLVVGGMVWIPVARLIAPHEARLIYYLIRHALPSFRPAKEHRV